MTVAAKKVYVTGLGAVSCLGIGVDEFWSNVLDGSSRFRPIDRFDLEGSSYSTAGLITDERFDVTEGCSLGARFAEEAAREACGNMTADERRELGLVLSTNFGPAEQIDRFLGGDEECDPDRLRDGFFSWDADHVAETLGIGGERINISLSCSSGNAALAQALDLIRAGHAGAVLAGGYDSIQKVTWAGLACLRVMAPTKEGELPKVRPFDANRSGTLFSEGAGLLLLESEEHARSRGAALLAELAGAGSNNNAYHMTHADKEGRATAEAVRMALDDAAVAPSDVDHFNAHGTGTKLNDSIETTALQSVFGEHLDDIPVTSIKGGLGHGMGAASALESIACVRSLQDGAIPPTINYETPDPECDLDIVAGSAREIPLRVIVNNSAGIGGANAAVVFRNVE